MPIFSTIPAAQRLWRPVTPVRYDAVGGGNANAVTVATTSASGSWTHTAQAGATVILGICVGCLEAYSAYTQSATYNSVAMTSIGTIQNNASATLGWTALFAIQNVPGGAQTAAYSFSGGPSATYLIVANTVSYTSVASLGSITTNSGSATALTSGTIASPTSKLVVHVMGGWNGGGGTPTISAYSGTSRYNQVVTSGSSGTGLVIGDKAGAASLTLTGTASVTDAYGSVAVPLSHR